MTDIHSHIIWDVDDGAPTIDVSLEMLKIARESGTTDIVATPHMNGQFSFQPDLVRERIAELEAALPEGPRIHYGCEFHLSVDNLDLLTASPRTYTINGKQYLLLECPDNHVGKHAETILGQLLDSGIVPIIAHPERVPVLQRDPDRLAQLGRSGLSDTGHGSFDHRYFRTDGCVGEREVSRPGSGPRRSQRRARSKLPPYPPGRGVRGGSG